MYTRYQRNTCFRETHVFTKNTFLDSHVTCFTRSLSTLVYTVFTTELHVLKSCKQHSCESHDTLSCVRPETMCFEMSQKSVRCDENNPCPINQCHVFNQRKAWSIISMSRAWSKESMLGSINVIHLPKASHDQAIKSMPLAWPKQSMFMLSPNIDMRLTKTSHDQLNQCRALDQNNPCSAQSMTYAVSSATILSIRKFFHTLKT